MAIDVLIGALIGGALTEGVTALSSGSKASKGPDQVAQPNQGTANKDASTTVSTDRAALLNAGGVTDYTGGLGVLTGADISKTSLIGG